MEQGNALLQFVHKNAEMGRGTIPQVLEAVEEPKLRAALKGQLGEYVTIAGRAEKLMRQRGIAPSETGQMREFMSGMMIRFKTLTDRSPSHIAEMMIQGSTMGTIQMTRRLHSCEAADGEALLLAHKLLRTEENNIEQMKEFL